MASQQFVEDVKTAFRECNQCRELLQEVREVLEGLSRYETSTGPCWCGSVTKHTDACQRARALMSKLEIKE